MSKRRRIVIFVSIGVVAGCGLTVLLSELLAPAEPMYQGQSLSEWLLSLDDSRSQEKSEEAERAIVQMGPKAVPGLRRYLNRKDSGLRHLLAENFEDSFHYTPQRDYQHRALRALKALGPIAKDAAPDLQKLLLSSEIPYTVAATIVQIDPDAARTLGQFTTHTNTGVRSAAVWTLGELTNRADEVIPVLLRSLKDSEVEVRRGAAWSLGNLKKQPHIVVPELAAGLSDTNAAYRVNLFLAIRAYSTNGKAAVPVLERLLCDSNQASRVYASVVLREVDPSSAERAGLSTPQILDKLTDLSKESKLEAMAILWMSERRNTAFLPALSACLADTNAEVRLRATFLLGYYGGTAKQALPALTRLLDDSDFEVREAATNSINDIDPDFLVKLQK